MLDKDGYAQIQRDGRKQQLHRYLYEREFGKLDKGLVVRHSCNNPSCINLNHLISGTARDNSTDMVISGRSARGERCARAKLTWDIVREIRKLKDKSCAEIGKLFNINPDNVWFIKNNRTWKETF
jgi:hypothetical protein